MFVILQAHVEERLVPLDQRRLQQQRLLRRLREDELDIRDLLYQPPCLRLEGVRGPEVGADAALQGGRLADVNDITLGVTEEVNAGARGERLQLCFELLLGRGHYDYSLAAAECHVPGSGWGC